MAREAFESGREGPDGVSLMHPPKVWKRHAEPRRGEKFGEVGVHACNTLMVLGAS